MKQPSKNEIDLLNLVNQIHAQLIALEMKVDTLIFRSASEAKASPRPPVNTTPPPAAKPNDRNNTRPMYNAVCADCKKECTIPFKPNGDRPVYCKDCFSRRKVISMSGMKMDNKPQENLTVKTQAVKEIAVPKTQAKAKKRNVVVKKPVAKKKKTAKKK